MPHVKHAQLSQSKIGVDLSVNSQYVRRDSMSWKMLLARPAHYSLLLFVKMRQIVIEHSAKSLFVNLDKLLLQKVHARNVNHLQPF